MVVPESGVVRAPQTLSDAQAACLPCAYVTAWSALVTQAQIHPGDVVLIQGTGGVAIAALQIALCLGARTIITSSSDDKLARARAMGAHHTINYVSEPDWGKRAAQMAGGEGVDLVVELGGAGTIAQSLRAVRIGGQISLIGVLAGNKQPIDVVPILMQNVRVQGIIVGARDGLHALCRAIDAHHIEPVVSDTFPFEHANKAFEHMQQATHFGKICVQITPED